MNENGRHPMQDPLHDSSHANLPVTQLRRGTRFIASKYGERYGCDRDDLFQEALIAAWKEPGPDGGDRTLTTAFKVRAGNRRAQQLATEHRRAFGHPGGYRSGATPPRSAIIGPPLDSDAVTCDRYEVTDPRLKKAVAALPQRDQRVVYALAFDLSPSESAEFVGVVPGYFRSLRSSVLAHLRATLEGAQ